MASPKFHPVSKVANGTWPVDLKLQCALHYLSINYYKDRASFKKKKNYYSASCYDKKSRDAVSLVVVLLKL